MYIIATTKVLLELYSQKETELRVHVSCIVVVLCTQLGRHAICCLPTNLRKPFILLFVSLVILAQLLISGQRLCVI